MILSKDLPGGNCRLLAVDGRDALLEEEQRDSKKEWFYWKFRAVFDAPGEYRFRFSRPNKIGTRGPAVSADRGGSWHWLSEGFFPDTQSFTFHCETPGEYWFSQCIPYLPADFEKFASAYRNDPSFRHFEFARTRKGRPVEMVCVREGEPAHAILLTARHHAQESMADYVMEGFLRAVLADDASGAAFRRDFAVYAVPFVDRDGVEDGDQGKGRLPRDHARDYDGESIYPEIAALRGKIREIDPFFVLDLHCPWLRFTTNEYSYLTGVPDPDVVIEMERFAAIFEKEAPPCAPFRKADILGYGVDWNVRANALTGTLPGYGLKTFCMKAGLKNIRFANTIEIPFANFREHTVTQDTCRAFGEALARAVRRYREVLQEEERKNRGVREASIAFYPTGRVKADHTVSGTDDPSAGIDLVATANAHALDRGMEELRRTLYRLDAAGVAHVGTARSVEEREKLVMKEICGIRVAFLACAAPFPAWKALAPEQRFAVSCPTEDELKKEIADARAARADFVVLLPGKGTDVPQLRELGADYVAEAGSPALVRLKKANGKTVILP